MAVLINCLKFKKEIVSRVEKLANAKLNGKSIKTINEYVISMINCYVGIISISQQEYESIDNEIRKSL